MYRTKTRYNKVGLTIARDYERCLSSMCHHVSNDDYYGRPFLLEDFQRENMWKPIFACGKVENGRFARKHRRAIFCLPSGFGKTETAAAMVLTIATMEVVHNGQYGVVASSVPQVRNIFDKIATMIKLNDTWSKQWEIGKDVIEHRETGAKIMVLPNKADALESWHFNVLIFDELHVYRDSSVWDAGVKGQKVIPNALTIGITTAGDAREGFLWDMLTDMGPKDPGMFIYWLGLDDSDDIDKKSAWRKLMVASWVTWDSIQDQRSTASSKRAFERYSANRFPNDANAYAFFTDRQLELCCRYNNDFDFSLPYTIGIDGATSGDSYAIVAYQERTSERGIVHGCTREWVFDEPDEDSGHYDLSAIMELLAGICERNWPEVIGIDPNRMLVMSSQLENMYGIQCVSFAQNNPTMCQATSLVVNAVKDKKTRLKGSPKLKEHLSHTVELEREPYGSRFGKDSRKSKIDAAIALAIAQLAYAKLVAGFEDYVPMND